MMAQIVSAAEVENRSAAAYPACQPECELGQRQFMGYSV